MVDYKEQGRKNRAKGAAFELKVRKDLEEKGWIVDKWTNNVDVEKQEIIKAKSNPFNKFNRSGNGFPDFIAIMETHKIKRTIGKDYRIMMVECKTNGTLKKIEKEKLDFLYKKGFRCFVARKEDREIKYERFEGYNGRKKRKSMERKKQD